MLCSLVEAARFAGCAERCSSGVQAYLDQVFAPALEREGGYGGPLAACVKELLAEAERCHVDLLGRAAVAYECVAAWRHNA